MENSASFKNIIEYRRSVRKYDENKEIDPQVVKKCIEQATLAPNSSNLQLWEFHHITSEKVLKNTSASFALYFG